MHVCLGWSNGAFKWKASEVAAMSSTHAQTGLCDLRGHGRLRSPFLSSSLIRTESTVCTLVEEHAGKWMADHCDRRTGASLSCRLHVIAEPHGENHHTTQPTFSFILSWWRQSLSVGNDRSSVKSQIRWKSVQQWAREIPAAKGKTEDANRLLMYNTSSWIDYNADVMLLCSWV